ncbi:MAG: YaiO family outer membrane beta-barrel protein [Candidatus Omnitrophota bacterium]
MKKEFWVCAALFVLCPAAWAEQVIVEKQIQETPVFAAPAEEKVFVSSFYEYSWIKQGGRHIQWKTSRNRIAWLKDGLHLPYLEVTRYERAGTVDYTFNLGGMLRLDADSLLRAEIGFGDDVDFVYRREYSAGYERRWLKNLFWSFDIKYLDYPENDVAIGSPGLIWYFDNHYISASYNVSSTESRGVAQWGIFKGNFYLHKRLDIWMGAAIGERLYDIFLLDASEQYGYILFAGLTFKVRENIDLRFGGSYSMEKPSFINRGVNTQLTVRF